MNQKFGFLSNFPGIKFDLRSKKKPALLAAEGELTDNPQQRKCQAEAHVTDDESDESDVDETLSIIHTRAPPINRILLDTSSNITLNPNINEEKRNTTRSKAADTLADTVVGGFSDEELSSRLSAMSVKAKDQDQRVLKGALRKTITGRFSDLSEEIEEPPSAAVIKQPVAKAQLADTIVGFSESMSGLSDSLIKEVEEEKVVEVESEEESEYDEDVITILDSEEENDVMNSEDQPPMLDTAESFHNCSSINSSPKMTDSDTTVNKFFNNPPLISNPERFITHSVIRRHKEAPDEVEEGEQLKATTANESIDRFKPHEEGVGDVDESFDAENIVLAETDVSDLHQTFTKETPDNDSQSHRTELATAPTALSPTDPSVLTFTQSSEDHLTIKKINISANININVKISLRNSSYSSNSSGSSESSISDDSQLPPPPRNPKKPAAKPKPTPNKDTKKIDTPRKETPKRDTPRKETPKAGPSTNKKVASVKKATPCSGKKNDRSSVDLLRAAPVINNYITPTKSDDFSIIDHDLQEALNSVYGESWKTPQLLESCKSKTVRQNLRKSIYSNNFNSFVKNLSNDLESTRISPLGGNEFQPLEIRRSVKKQQQKVKTPTVLQPKQPDKPGSSLRKKPPASAKKIIRRVSTSDESDFESPVVKAMPTSAAKSASKTTRYIEICDSDTPSEDDSTDSDFDCNETWNASSDEEYENEQERINKRKSQKREDIIFIPDEKNKIDDLLDRFEFKKPPGMLTPKIAKKKLFTHTHYEDEAQPPPEEPAIKEKENNEAALNLREVFFRNPFPVKKIVEVIPPTPSPKTNRKTPKSSSKAPMKIANDFAKFSFLKSLDVEANPVLCHPDAYEFRRNYKTKRDELTGILFKLYNEKIFDDKLANMQIKWNKKLLNTAGRCNNSRRNGVRQSQLELSDKVLTSADRLRCTLIHEMCHAATWILHGENGHGPTWKNLAAKANTVFPELAKISVCHSYTIEYKYTYQCKNCKGKYQTHSKCKKVDAIRCSICKGPIELFLNKKDKNGEVVMTPVSKDVKGFAKFVKINYKEVKQPKMTHKEVMQVLSGRYAALSAEEKQTI